MDITEERSIKHHRMVTYLQEHGLDAVLLARRCNFSWYTSGAYNHIITACDVGNSYLLVSTSFTKAITDNIEATRLRSEVFADWPVEIIEYPYFDSTAAADVISNQLDNMRVAADWPNPFGLPVLKEDFDRLRWELTPSEISRYRSLCSDTIAAIEQIARIAKPGQRENELAGMLSDALMRRGCLPWLVLVGGDDRVEKFRHPLPTDKVIRKYFMLVACAERFGLIASFTRLGAFGRVPAELDGRQPAVATVLAAFVGATRQGKTLGEMFTEAQEAYTASGFADEWRLHHQGGSCGYQPRDVKATPGEKTIAIANQAFAWNPSITGTKCEDTIICLPEKTESLAETSGSNWPTISADWKGFSYSSADILIK